MKIRKNAKLRMIGQEFIVMLSDNDKMDMTRAVCLNESAAYLWNEIFGRDFTKEELVDLLIKKYGIDRNLAINDIDALISTLKTAEIIVK